MRFLKALTCVVLSLIAIDAAAVPMTMTHQGRLLDSGGSPVNGPVDLTFRLYDVAVGGGVLWEEVNLVTVDDGLYSVILGQSTPLDFSVIGIRPDSLWLEIQVNADLPLTPRVRLTSSPLSAVSTSLRGDVLSAPNQLFLTDSLGDTTITLSGVKDDNGSGAAQVVITKIEPAGISFTGRDSSGVIRAWSDLNPFGNGVITELVAGLPPGEPLIRTEVVPPGRMSFDNIKNGGFDTTRVVEIGSYEAGGFISLADSVGDSMTVLEDGEVRIRRGTSIGKWTSVDDIADPEFKGLVRTEVSDAGPVMAMLDSLGDTTLFINGGQKKGDKISLVGFGSLNKKMSIRNDGMVVIDTLGDTTVMIDGGLDNFRFIRVRVHFDVAATDYRDDTYISPGEIELNSNADLSGTGTFDPNGGTRIHHAGLEVIDQVGDTVASIDSAGNIYAESTVSIGTALDESIALNVDGDICYTGTISACSDARFKDNVHQLSDALANLMNLRGVSYTWKQDEQNGRSFDDRTHLGFIAQEVESLYPEVVKTDSEGYKSVDYSRLAPILVEAMKEQQAQIEELKSLVRQLVSAQSGNDKEYGLK